MSYTSNVIPVLVVFAVIAIVCAAIICFVAWSQHSYNEETQRFQQEKNKAIIEGAYGSRFIPAGEFERDWIVSRAGRSQTGFAGYKYVDGPGCYVILMFSHAVLDGNWSTFDDVYIGQSVNMCKRVHAHFNGKGNGDVYADLRNGKHVYVQFKPCEKAQMNDLEKALIATYRATNSYNKTRGGSSLRQADFVHVDTQM